MDPTDTMTRGAPPGGLPSDGAPPGGRASTAPSARPGAAPEPLPDSDRALLDVALADLLDENRARARRLEAVHAFHARRAAELEENRGGFFALTPLQATLVEFAPLLGLSEFTIQINLDITEGLIRWFPRLWQLCREGRLDVGKAQVAYEHLGHLTNDTDKAAYAELVEEYVDKVDVPECPLFPVSRRAFQQAVHRRCKKFPQKSEQDSFAEAFKKRRVNLRTEENGMASMAVGTAVHSVMAADYRLTLIAKKLREQDGEERTLQQLRADVLIDLIHGRLTVSATDGELEDDCTADGRDPVGTFEQHEVGRFARPVVHVTAPVTTLMGLSDEPGTMAGGESLPADLVRLIAIEPGSTWYRLLTDSTGQFLELSTSSYQPTQPVFRWVVARDSQCVWPDCSRPASTIELDHRVPFPFGLTTTQNLQPLCRHHHLVKHSEGVQVERGVDGSYTWTTRFGSTFRTPAPEYPSPVWPELGRALDRRSTLDLDDWEVDEWDAAEAAEYADAVDPDRFDEELRRLVDQWLDGHATERPNDPGK